MYRRSAPRRRGGGCSLSMGRILMGLIIAAVSLFTYFSNQSENPITGEVQHIDITTEQEIALGLEAAPQLARQFGGLDPSEADRALVKQVGERLVNSSLAGQTDYEFDFHLLADSQTVNAFALPGGQIFITRALYDRFSNEAELAGVLGHEIGHVVARHSAEQIAKARLTEGLTGAAVIASYDPNNPSSASAAQVAMVVGQLINLRYGRQDELESDFLGVCFMKEAGYDPRHLITVMEILSEASGGGGRQPEFLSTHPDPGNRIERIRSTIQNTDQCPVR
jgi:beta-barrel assembly-enhancing protease